MPLTDDQKKKITKKKRLPRTKAKAEIVPAAPSVEVVDDLGDVLKEALPENGQLPQSTPGYIPRKQQREFERILQMNKDEKFHPYLEAILFIRDEENPSSLRLQMILKTMELQSSPMPPEGAPVDVDVSSIGGANGRPTRIGIIVEH